MNEADPYLSLKKALKAIILSGSAHDILMYRTDIPDYIETGTAALRIDRMRSGRQGLVVTDTNMPYRWKSETRFFSIPQERHDDHLGGRIKILFDEPIMGERELLKYHRDLIDAGVRAPLYFRLRPAEGFRREVPFTGVSFSSDSDAVICAGFLTIA